MLRALESVLTSPCVTELVAVDDGSRDRGPSLVRELARREPRLVLAKSPGKGVAAALASGVARSRGAFVGRMDADDESRPGRFPASLDLLLSDPSLGAVATRVEIASELEKPGLEAYVAWQNALVTKEQHAHARFVESPMCHPATVFRRTALDAVGGYVETAWPEDYDLYLRLVAAGFGLAKVPETHFVWHHVEGRVSFADPRCSPRALVAARAHHLARVLREKDRGFVIWGAGDAGKRLARALAIEGLQPMAFVDRDPRKIGNLVHGARVVSESSRPEGVFVVIALRARGARALSASERERDETRDETRAEIAGYARDMVRDRLIARGLVEGRDFLAAA